MGQLKIRILANGHGKYDKNQVKFTLTEKNKMKCQCLTLAVVQNPGFILDTRNLITLPGRTCLLLNSMHLYRVKLSHYVQNRCSRIKSSRNYLKCCLFLTFLLNNSEFDLDCSGHGDILDYHGNLSRSCTQLGSLKWRCKWIKVGHRWGSPQAL